jgi:16S rRNA (guanine1516-N2)-methyltransferase
LHFPSVDIFCETEELRAKAARCAEALDVVPDRATDAAYQLWFSAEGVYLRAAAERHGRIFVDFCAGGAAHRRLYGGGTGQMIAKAVGVSAKILPEVLDATAGLGADALMERSPVVFALLEDGLARARCFAEQGDEALAGILARMQLLPGDSIEYLQGQTQSVADVIYLDPMFPERRKSAAVKKEMQAFHAVVGADSDSERLLQAALTKARYRVAVKRPRLAPAIQGATPSHSIEGKSSRYDIYALRSLAKLAES